MSLNWNWTDKMGEIIYNPIPASTSPVPATANPATPAEATPRPRPYVTNIYQGNALMIWVNESVEDKTYCLNNFCADMEHFKNMLGLNAKKGYGTENLFEGWCEDIKVIRLNTRYKSVPKIVEAFARAKTPVTIELYYEDAKR